VAWYGWIEIRGSTDGATVTRVTDWSSQAADTISRNRLLLGVALAAVVAGAVAYLSLVRSSARDESDADASVG
jgi:hypothetical protein